LLEMNDGSLRLVSALLEPDFHMIITDWQEMVVERELKVKAERSESWANTIDAHPQNKSTVRRTEQDATIALIGCWSTCRSSSRPGRRPSSSR
jgi:hypothetical protein